MNQSTRFAAEILEASASGYAGYAASLLLERRPEVEERYAPSAVRYWRKNLTQRALELAAALEAEEPRLFASRVRWARQAFRARDLEDGDLHASIACLDEVLSEEMPESARRDVAGYLKPVLASLNAPIAKRSGAPGHEPWLDPESVNGRLALRYLQAVLEGDNRGAIDRVIAAAEDGVSTEALYLEVLLAVQRAIGEMWHLGEIGVAEEHYVTSTTERAMAILAQRSTRRESVGKTVIAAAVAGNSHGLGARVVADFFEISGWRAICLGADVPSSEVAAAAVYFEADLAVLSAALATQLKTVGQAVDAVRSLPDREVKVLVGGVAFADVPDLWQRLGADGYAPAANVAVELGGRLAGLKPD